MFKAKWRLFGGFLLLVLLVGWPEYAKCQEKYPTRAINMICPFAPGGSPDMTARIMGPYLTQKWEVPINVLNKPGGNTIVAQVELYNSPPDGYTLYTDGPPTPGLSAVENVPFKILDRTFVAIVSYTPIIMVVASNSPYKTLKDIIVDAQKDPANFTWGSLGGTGGSDLLARQFFKAINVDAEKTKPVIGKGGTQCATMAAGGHIKMAWVALPSANPVIQGGTARVLAVASKERTPLLPNVPSTAELGYPNISYMFWIGYSGPPKMPAYVVDKWDKIIGEVNKNPEYVSNLKKIGCVPYYMNASSMREHMRKEAEDVEILFDIKKKK